MREIRPRRPRQPFQGFEKPEAEIGDSLPEAAQWPYRLAPRSRGERQPREARWVSGTRSRLFARHPSPADADVVGLSPTERGEDLGPREHLERAGVLANREQRALP
jgi:hypothetical protein